MRKRINREILKLAVPSILANITVPLVGMVDIAVAGHLTGGEGSAALIGGIAIGSMLFDLLYWNFAFLRISTGGMTAQAYGRWGAARAAAAGAASAAGSAEGGAPGGPATAFAGAASTSAADAARSECAQTLLRSLGVALASALALIAIQWIFVQGAFCIVKCTPEVRDLAQQYFYIRIWAAPATLCLMAFKGWYIGMQDSVTTMTLDLIINTVNIIGSIVLSLGLGVWAGFGFKGVAIGTVLAQYTGLLTAFLILLFKYRKKVFVGSDLSFSQLFRSDKTKKFFSMNGDISVRSLCFIAIYIGFTIISARYGDTLLATCSIMMKLLMIFSYFIDGFAYAGEAMIGKYIGAKDPQSTRASLEWNLVWCGGIAVLFMFIYGFGGNLLLKLMTSDPTVLDAARAFIPWLLAMPFAGCLAFAFDGIYIGATDSRRVRNSMLWATVAFFTVWFGGIWFFNPGTALASLQPTNETAVHLLMTAYFAHLLARAIYLSVSCPKNILRKYC